MDVMVFQIRFQNILINEGVFPTLEAGWSTGGCLAPKVMYWEESGDEGEDGDGLQSGDDAPIRGSCVD